MAIIIDTTTQKKIMPMRLVHPSMSPVFFCGVVPHGRGYLKSYGSSDSNALHPVRNHGVSRSRSNGYSMYLSLYAHLVSTLEENCPHLQNRLKQQVGDQTHIKGPLQQNY